MIVNQLDSITFRLREQQDFTWLKRYGTAFWAVDETGSGCVCIGMQDADRKLFCKIAGVNTLEADVTPEESIALLKNAVHLYETLAHPHLIRRCLNGLRASVSLTIGTSKLTSRIRPSKAPGIASKPCLPA